MMKKIHNQGLSVVEAVIALAIFAVLVGATYETQILSGRLGTRSDQAAQALGRAEEGLEVVRMMRDDDFANLTPGVTGLVFDGSAWSFSGTSDTSDGFERALTLSALDADTFRVDSSVSWSDRGSTSTRSLSTVLTNWHKVVTLAANWANATTTASIDLSGTNDGVAVSIDGDYAYAVRSNGTPDFVVIDISSPSSPSVVGSLSLSGVPTNIFVPPGSTYAYVTNNSNSQELQIINISNPASPSVAGTYNASGNADARGIYVSGSTGYLVRSRNAPNEFEVLNLAVPTVPVLLGSIDLGANGYEVVVAGSYAYVASGSNTQELQVINVANSLLPTIDGSFNLSSNTDALTLAKNGSTIYLGQGSNLAALDVSTPTNPTLLGTLGLGGIVRDIAFESTQPYVFVGTSNTSGEFWVVDASAPTTLTSATSIDIPGNESIFGVAYDALQEVVVGVASGNNQEVFIFSPQ